MVTGPLPVLGQDPPGHAGPGKWVAIDYTLRTNGAIRHVRSSEWGDASLQYHHGDGRLLPALERALEGLAPGERVTVTLAPADAYGERDPALQQQVPVEVFGGAGQVTAGMCLFGRSDDGRHVERLLVTEVDAEAGIVLVDANHPLAGMTLEYDVTVVAVRDTGPAAPGQPDNPDGGGR